MRRQAIALGVLTAVLLFGGCAGEGATSDGSGSGENKGETSGSGADPGGGRTGDEHDRQLRYAECLREHGLDVEDPSSDGLGPRAEENTDPELLRQAMTACVEYAPESARDRENDPELRDAMLRLAECLRDQGIEVSDPGPEGLIDFDEKVRADPRFGEAMDTCGQRMSDQLGKVGQR